MCDKFSKILRDKGYLLADGATGTSLFNMGLSAGEAPEFWNKMHPEKIKALYKGAVDAGSDLFLTNSFGANAARLKLHDAADESFTLARVSAEIGREVADGSGRDVIVAGSLGPTGELMAPIGSLTHENAVEIFSAQIEGLKAGGADILWFETISDANEARAGAEAAIKSGMAWALTMSFDTAGRTMMGFAPPHFHDLIDGFSAPPHAFGANCGVGASDLVRSVLEFPKSDIPIIAKANAGIPKYHDGAIEYDGTPALMADYAVLARAAGAKIIGGCCGTTPAHIAAMRHALESTPPPSDAPTLEEISARLGGFSSPTTASQGATPSRPRRRKRRT